MADTERVWRCVLEKAYTAMNPPLRVILVRAQKEKRYAAEACPRQWKNDPTGLSELIRAALSSQARSARAWVGGRFRRRGLRCRAPLSTQGGGTGHCSRRPRAVQHALQLAKLWGAWLPPAGRRRAVSRVELPVRCSSPGEPSKAMGAA